jgi:hypothetical protein
VIANGTADVRRTPAWLIVALVAVVGVANALVTLLAFGTLGEGWNTLGNSGAMWLLVAFGVGAVMPTAGLAVAGATASLVGSVVWFYMAAHYLVGMPVSSAAIAIWLIASLAGGPLYGLAGRWWRHGLGASHVIGLALMGGVFMAEGVFTIINNYRLPIVGWVAVGVGAVFTIALARSTQDRVLGLVALPVVAALAIVAYAGIYGALALA